MAFKLKASRVLAITVFLVSLSDSFSFSTFEILSSLTCWSGSLGLSFIQLLGLYFKTCPAMFFCFVV